MTKFLISLRIGDISEFCIDFDKRKCPYPRVLCMGMSKNQKWVAQSVSELRTAIIGRDDQMTKKNQGSFNFGKNSGQNGP